MKNENNLPNSNQQNTAVYPKVVSEIVPNANQPSTLTENRASPVNISNGNEVDRESQKMLPTF